MTHSENPVPARLRGELLGHLPDGLAFHGPIPKGTAPSITPDLDMIFQLLQEELPEVQWTQLPVTHPSDDDGLWFFWIPEASGEVQIESSSGFCPFLIATDKHDQHRNADSPKEVAAIVLEWLAMPGGRPSSPWHPR